MTLLTQIYEKVLSCNEKQKKQKKQKKKKRKKKRKTKMEINSFLIYLFSLDRNLSII